MTRTDRQIVCFALFETIGLAALLALSTAGVDEFRHVDPVGWWPAFIAMQAVAAIGLLVGGGLACGWALNRLRLLVAARRVTKIFHAA